jgi:hypothetical protein
MPSEEVYSNDHQGCSKPNPVGLTGMIIFRKRKYDTNNDSIQRDLKGTGILHNITIY